MTVEVFPPPAPPIGDGGGVNLFLSLRSWGLRGGAWGVVAVVAAPVLAVLAAAWLPGSWFLGLGDYGLVLGGTLSEGTLSGGALWHYFLQTVFYGGGVTVLAIAIALPAAWATVMRAFPGARFFSWALFLPFALPPYLTAYIYADFFDSLGINFRGMGAAAAVTALALYPYVYLFARAAMRQQSCHIQSAARLMGHSPWSVFWRVSFPLARPALAVGAALTLMETLNDVAVAEHYGIQPLGIAVYDLWLNRGDLRSSCRLATVTMFVVAALAVWERNGYRAQKRHLLHCDRCFSCERAPKFGGVWGVAAPLLLSLPVLAGFVFPLLRLLFLSADSPLRFWREAFAGGFLGSLALALSVIVVSLFLAAVFVMERRTNGRGGVFAGIARIAQSGYALPGAILAQGFFVLAAVFSGAGFIAYGGMVLVVAACCARFFLIPSGALEEGLDKVSPQLDSAARLMPPGRLPLFFRLHLPLMRPAAVMAAAILLLESFKELPMTLILRPFGFDTLATTVYQYASDEAMAAAAPAAVLLTVAGAFLVSAVHLLEGKDLRGRTQTERMENR